MSEAVSCLVVATAFSLALTARTASAQQLDFGASPEVLLQQAKSAFDGLDYERAVMILDRVVTALELKGPLDRPQRQQLIDAYELRGRSRFGLGDQDGVRSDFKKLVELDPGHTLPGQISPNVVRILDELKKTLAGLLNFTVTPDDAEVLIDDVPLPKGERGAAILTGEHRIEIRKLGYRSDIQVTKIEGGAIIPIVAVLERVSATIAIVTSPAEVEVLVDGVSRGFTTAGPPAAEPNPSVSAPSGGVDPVPSQPLVLGEITTGNHLIEFRKDCYVSAEQRLDVPEPHDYTLPPVRLAKAVGTLVVESASPANVFLDNLSRGTTPLTLDDICEGSHLVEMRSRYGRLGQRVDIQPASRVTVRGDLVPAVAIMPATGLEGLRGVPDVRARVQDALKSVRSITFLAPPPDELAQALAREQLQPAWLSFDSEHRPLEPAAANITATARQELSTRLTQALDVQALASVTVPARESPLDVFLTILADGSAEPDTIRVKLDDASSLQHAIEQLDGRPALFKSSIGLRVADVLDVAGIVVVGVDEDGPAASAGISVGDVIVRVNNEPVPDALHLNAPVGAGEADRRLILDVRARTGVSKQVTLQTIHVPQVVAKENQTILFNPMIIDFRNRVQRSASGLDQSVVGLNLAVALMKVGAWTEARAELQKVRLPDGPGVANGTVQYLLGLCQEAVGDRTEADVAWKKAASSPALLTSDGPPIKELAENKLQAAGSKRQ